MSTARGFTLLEVLITLIILAVGMLGLANLQSKIHVTEIESYQRAQAVVLLQDMVDRINSNRQAAGGYVQKNPVGTDADPLDSGNFESDCVTACKTNNDPDPDCSSVCKMAFEDVSDWNDSLLGASEQSKGGTNAGGMIGARGCIEEVIAPDDTIGVCQAGVYRVTVAWQGLHVTAPPADGLTCAKDLYGKDGLRRAITAEVSIGLPKCTSPPE